MPILIDGHNLIGQMHTISLADPDDEAQLVMLLRRYATKKRGRKVYSARVRAGHHARIRVYWSG